MAHDAEQAIYNRISGIDNFHPANAQLLPTDWSIEPGDIVTVKSGETSYTVPVYAIDMQWQANSQNGTCASSTMRVSVESTGNRTREPLSELKRKEYETNSATYRQGRAVKKQEEELDGYYQRFIEQKGLVGMIAGSTGIKLDAEGRPVIDEATGKFVYDPTSPAEVFTQLALSPNQAELISAINSADGRISHARVDLDAAGNILIEAINKRGDATVNIRGDRVVINGRTLVDELEAINAYIKNLTAGRAEASVITSSFINADHIKTGLLNVSEDFVFRNDRIGKFNVSMTGIAATGRFLGMQGVNLAHSHSVTMAEITTGDNAGKVKAEIGGAVETTDDSRISFFDIAASDTYVAGVAAAWTTATGYVALPSVPQEPTNEFEFSYPIYVPSTGASGQDSTTYELSQGTWDSSHQRIVTVTEQGESDIIAQTTVDASTVYTAGQNDVNIVKGIWGAGSTTGTREIDFTKSAGTQDTKSVVLSLASVQMVSTDPNQWTVTAYDGNANTGASIIVDASSRYTAGKTAHTATSAGTVTLTSSDTGSSVSKNTTVTYSNGDTTANVPITIDASAVYGQGKTDHTVSSISNISITAAEASGDISDITKTVTVTYSNGDTASVTLTIDATAVYNAGYADGQAASSTFDITKLTINLGNDSDPTAQVPSKTTDRQNNRVLVSGKIGVWYDDTYIGELRTFSFSVGYGTPYINNHAQGYVRGAVTINGDTITGTAIKLTESQISSWGGPIT